LGHATLPLQAACSLELSFAYFQPVSKIFLSQQISQQYFQPLIFSQANRLKDGHEISCHAALSRWRLQMHQQAQWNMGWIVGYGLLVWVR
jgi:hypothetical protein